MFVITINIKYEQSSRKTTRPTKSEYSNIETKKRGSYRRSLTHLPITTRQSDKKDPRHVVAVLYSPQKCLTQLKMHSS